MAGNPSPWLWCTTFSSSAFTPPRVWSVRNGARYWWVVWRVSGTWAWYGGSAVPFCGLLSWYSQAWLLNWFQKRYDRSWMSIMRSSGPGESLNRWQPTTLSIITPNGNLRKVTAAVAVSMASVWNMSLGGLVEILPMRIRYDGVEPPWIPFSRGEWGNESFGNCEPVRAGIDAWLL